jgi:hypothetical protein
MHGILFSFDELVNCSHFSVYVEFISNSFFSLICLYNEEGDCFFYLNVFYLGVYAFFDQSGES